MLDTWNQKITILSRIKAKDNGTNADEWIATTHNNCFWKADTVIADNTTQPVQSNTYTVRIPHDESYHAYSDYIVNREGWTVSIGDIVVLGDADVSAVSKINKLKPNAFVVTAFADDTLVPHLRHYRLGG